MGKIKCPYCFEEFESDKVLFRANTGFTQEELDLSLIHISEPTRP